MGKRRARKNNIKTRSESSRMNEFKSITEMAERKSRFNSN